MCKKGPVKNLLCRELLDLSGSEAHEVPPVFRLPRGGVHATSFSFC
jgi:hypothetical protein